MNVHDRFLEHLSSDALDESDRSHAAGCPECAPLLPREADVAPVAALAPIHARALETMRSSPVRPWQRDAALLAGLNAVVALAATFFLGAVRGPAFDAEHGRLALVGVLFFGTLTLGGIAALTPRRRHSPLFLLLAFLLPLGLVFAGDGWVSAQTLSEAFPCAVIVTLTAVLPLAAALFVLRRMAFDGRRAAALALASGATGLFALHWHCVDGSALHLLGFHALPWLSLAAVVVAFRRLLPTQSHVP